MPIQIGTGPWMSVNFRALMSPISPSPDTTLDMSYWRSQGQSPATHVEISAGGAHAPVNVGKIAVMNSHESLSMNVNYLSIAWRRTVAI